MIEVSQILLIKHVIMQNVMNMTPISNVITHSSIELPTSFFSTYQSYSARMPRIFSINLVYRTIPRMLRPTEDVYEMILS